MMHGRQGHGVGQREGHDGSHPVRHAHPMGQVRQEIEKRKVETVDTHRRVQGKWKGHVAMVADAARQGVLRGPEHGQSVRLGLLLLVRLRWLQVVVVEVVHVLLNQSVLLLVRVQCQGVVMLHELVQVLRLRWGLKLVAHDSQFHSA